MGVVGGIWPAGVLSPEEEEVEEEDVKPDRRRGSGIVGKIFLNPGEGVFVVGVKGAGEWGTAEVGVLSACPGVGVPGEDGWTVSCGGFCGWERDSGGEAERGMGSECGFGREGKVSWGFGRSGKVSSSSSKSESPSASSKMDSASEERPPSSWNASAWARA